MSHRFTRNEADQLSVITTAQSALCVLQSNGKLVRNSILAHLINHGILSDYQHGVVCERFRTTKLLKVIDKRTETLDQVQLWCCIPGFCERV